MKQFIFKSKCHALALAMLLSPAPVFAAKTLDDVYNIINSIYQWLDTTMLRNNWLGEQPNLQNTQKMNNTSSTLNNTVTAMSGGAADESFKAVAAVIGPNSNPGIGAALLSFPAGDSLLPANSPNTSGSVLNSIYGNCGDNAFNFEMLMSPLSYGKVRLPCAPVDQDISSYANAYIQYAAGFGNPLSTYSINQLVTGNSLTSTQADDLAKSPEWQDFALTRRHLLATQSAGVSNLYYLMKLRTPDKSGVSPAQAAFNVANWRTATPPEGTAADKTWYMQMQTALPAMVARESLFVLAEIQRDLHAMRLENQRLLALLSVQEVASIAPGKMMLDVKLAAVNTKVATLTAPVTPSGSAPPSTTGGQSGSSSSVQMPELPKELPKIPELPKNIDEQIKNLQH